jgi:hypothetical protein
MLNYFGQPVPPACEEGRPLERSHSTRDWQRARVKSCSPPRLRARATAPATENEPWEEPTWMFQVAHWSLALPNSPSSLLRFGQDACRRSSEE